MNATQDDTSLVIEAQLVRLGERTETLPKHFGRYAPTVELLAYHFADTLVPNYRGAYWEFYELSNGGVYLAPSIPATRVCVDGNGFEGEMSADAIGVTVSLFAFSHGSFQYPSETFAKHYALLREFSYGHPEAGLIIAATD